MMKQLVCTFLFALALVATANAQLGDVSNSPGNVGGIAPFADADGLRNPESLIQNIDVQKILGWASVTEFDDIRLSKLDVNGSVFLFDEWDNKGAIEVGDKRYIFSNMNFSVRSSVFMSKISEDSVVSFDISAYDRILINDRPFKSIYNPGKNGNQVFEVIYEGEDFSLLKNYYLHISESSPNPMVNRARTKIIKKKDYFILVEGVVEPFRMKKKSLLELVGDRGDDLEAYAKAHGLSFRKDEDVRAMLSNY
jgi:hypothetical protein